MTLTRRTLIHVLPSGEWGGKERYAFDISRYFKDCGWDVRVMTRDARAVDGCFLKAGIPVEHAPLRQYPDYYSARAMARLFAATPRGEGIVHVHRYNDALTCILARRLARRPDIRLVATRHKADCGRDSLLRRVIYRGLDSHLFVSEFAKRRFYERWPEEKSPLDEAKTAITYNSLYLPGYAPDFQPQSTPLAAAYRGGLKPGKGLETLIDALALVKPTTKVRLLIMGKGHPDYVDRLRRRAQLADVADRIDWIRDTDFAEKYMSRVHFGVLPSDEPEAFGMANIEFMAYGKPQISTFGGAQEEVLERGGDSLEVPAQNAEALAGAIRTLALDADLRLRMGRRAYERYEERFAWPRFIDRLLCHYIAP